MTFQGAKSFDRVVGLSNEALGMFVAIAPE